MIGVLSPIRDEAQIILLPVFKTGPTFSADQRSSPSNIGAEFKSFLVYADA